MGLIPQDRTDDTMHNSHAADRKRAREADSDSDAASEDHDEAPQKQMRGEAAARTGTGGQKKPRGRIGMSGYKGVTLSGNSWEASARKEGKRHYLGCFVSPEEAAVAVRHFEDTGEKKPEWGEGRKKK